MLKKLKKHLESEKKDNAIFDIVLYGSAVKGKISFKEIDIMIIFLEGSLKQRLNKIQEIKNKIKTDKKLDIKQMLLKDLFKPEFFAKTGILLEGISIFKKQNFCETLGFRPYTLFWYDLKNLTHTQKVKFNYILSGRNSEGILKLLKGKRLVNSAVKIPIQNTLKFENILKTNKINYEKKNILEEI